MLAEQLGPGVTEVLGGELLEEGPVQVEVLQGGLTLHFAKIIRVDPVPVVLGHSGVRRQGFTEMLHGRTALAQRRRARILVHARQSEAHA